MKPTNKSPKKSILNFFSFADMAALFIWLAVFVLARITANNNFADYFAAAFVIVYLAVTVWVLAYTVISVILLIKKSEFSAVLLIFTYALNIAFIALLIWSIINIKVMGSTVLEY